MPLTAWELLTKHQQKILFIKSQLKIQATLSHFEDWRGPTKNIISITTALPVNDGMLQYSFCTVLNMYLDYPGKEAKICVCPRE